MNLMWNHRIHERWGKERLYYWQLSFRPTYDQGEILKNLSSLFIDLEIKSYVIYELTGLIDIMLRIWLPVSISTACFKEKLEGKLRPLGLHDCDEFSVRKIVSHWVWNNGNGIVREPANEVLINQFDDATIDKINQRKINKEEAIQYAKKNIITTFRPVSGIKFIIVVPKPMYNFSLESVKGVEDRILNILLEVKNIEEISLYIGVGFGHCLIQGKTTPDKFKCVYDELVKKINDFGFQDFFRVRTFTHIAVNSLDDPRFYSDKLPLNSDVVDDEKITIEEYLIKEESENLEIKGSLSLDINQWLNGGPLTKVDKIAIEGVLRTIVSFLNSRGGKLILGVLERKKYKAMTNRERVDKLLPFQDYYIYGIENEYKGQSWDLFNLRLWDLITNNIEGPASTWISVREESFMNKKLCIIIVRQPNDGWFYLKGDAKLYHRQGNRNINLSGIEADNYKKSMAEYRRTCPSGS